MDLAGNGAGFTDAELLQIQDIYQRVAEDYAPFDVDVTTEEPPAARLDRANAGDSVYGTRALISPGSTSAANTICNNQCGGVAFIGVFNHFAGNNGRPDNARAVPAGLGVPAAARQRREEHRRGDHPRGRPQPRPRPRRAPAPGLLRRPRHVGADHGRRLPAPDLAVRAERLPGRRPRRTRPLAAAQPRRPRHDQRLRPGGPCRRGRRKSIGNAGALPAGSAYIHRP